MYFLLRSTPLDLSADRLRGLRLSLNTPVVSIEELPVEPARAAIAIHDEVDGRPNVTVGVCSLRSGASALFSFDGPLRESGTLTNRLDVALSFGESMGFLFDEDELEGGSEEEARLRALDLWLELMSPAARESKLTLEAEPPSASGRGGGLEDGRLEEEVLLLDEVADPEDDFPDVGVEELDGVDSEPPVPLTKFRHGAPSRPPRPQEQAPSRDVGTRPPAVKGAPLGRLKLVKRRKGEVEAPAKPSAIRRLLCSF